MDLQELVGQLAASGQVPDALRLRLNYGLSRSQALAVQGAVRDALAAGASPDRTPEWVRRAQAGGLPAKTLSGGTRSTTARMGLSAVVKASS